MKLPVDRIELDERNTLTQIMKELRGYLSKEDFGSLNMFHRSFNMTFQFLLEIWDRILKDAELDIEYWETYADLYEPGATQREPTQEEAEILATWREHRFRINLDVEDWFIHSAILMDKYAKFVKRLFQIISKSDPQELLFVQRIPHKNFDKHRKYYLDSARNHLITDIKYAEIMRQHANWYIRDLKNIRDDLVEHESTPKFWAYHIAQDEIRLSRFRPNPRMYEILVDLRRRYSVSHPEMGKISNPLGLLTCLEKNIDHLDKDDQQLVDRIRKIYGTRFPDIPALFDKISDFFSIVNDHFALEIQERFKEQAGA